MTDKGKDVKDKAYFIGDNRDEKSARIDGEFYLPGEEIPVDKVDPARLDNWVKRGIVVIGVNKAPILVKDTGTIKGLEAEIRDLKSKLDSLPGLEKQNDELRDALDKAKSGKNAKAVKALEQDVAEKDALIKKLEKDLEDATAPADTGGNDSGGPS